MDASRKILIRLIVIGSILRVMLAQTFPLGNDEAYHTLFLRHPAASYFDHPPMLMVIESVGMTLLGQTAETVSALGARLGFIGLFAGSTWMMFRLTRRMFGTEAGVMAAIVLNASAYHSVAAGTFALPDGPLLFFWLLTMDRLAVALDATERGEKALRVWSQVGLVWGLAMLSKYHAVFLPLGAVIYLMVRPGCRRALVWPGPWLAVLVGVVIFSPVIWWNATHQWASFAFQSGRAVGGGFNAGTLAGAIGGQIAYLTPWIWWPAMMGVYALLRPSVWGQRQEADGASLSSLNKRLFLLGLIMPASIVFLNVAARKAVLPHWSLVGLIPTFPMIGRAWADGLADAGRRESVMRRVRFGLGFVVAGGLFVSLHAEYGLVPWAKLGQTGNKMAQVDMTLEDMVWPEVCRQMKERGWVPGAEGFVFTSRWYESGHLARELGPETTVLCYNMKDSRGFADWNRPEDYVGRDGVLVSMSAKPNIEPACYEKWFERIEPLGEIEIKDDGIVIRKARVFRCVRQKTVFPFDRRVIVDKPGRMVAGRPVVEGQQPVRK